MADAGAPVWLHSCNKQGPFSDCGFQMTRAAAAGTEARDSHERRFWHVSRITAHNLVIMMRVGHQHEE